MQLAEIIRKKSAQYLDEVIAIRRHIHMHPELSFREHETSAFVKKRLEEYGLDCKTVAGTGLLATITGKAGRSSKCIALRAELDALPVTEKNDLPWRSLVPGVMHACGHDVHASCLIGAARIIKELEDEFTGTVHLLFQPGEETLPGGAKKLLEEKVFGNNQPSVVIAQHVLPELGAGETGIRPGVYMASGDEIYITVSGKGGHGATPDKTVDTVAAMSHVVVALQQVSSRFAPPHIPTVLSFGKFIANGATNVIPGEVIIEGTFRTMDEEWRAEAHEIINRIAVNIATSLGASCSVEIRKGYPVLYNDPGMTSLMGSYMKEYLGSRKVKDLQIRMTTEDFAWFAREYPAVFYRLGTGMPDRLLHSPEFDIDEQIMLEGTGLPAWLALSFLLQ
ncbi:MAG: amidohydrolase [Marinilabiliales bacterium]|nr:MAG: amidohydrolase [Marinilabiliales bacterium]